MWYSAKGDALFLASDTVDDDDEESLNDDENDNSSTTTTTDVDDDMYSIDTFVGLDDEDIGEVTVTMSSS